MALIEYKEYHSCVRAYDKNGKLIGKSKNCGKLKKRETGVKALKSIVKRMKEEGAK